MKINHLADNKALWALSMGALWERFCFFGLLTNLIIMLVSYWKTGAHVSYAIYGTYATLAFSLPLLGGIMADRWLDRINAILMGYLLVILGALGMMGAGQEAFYAGLACYLVGSALCRPSIATLVGEYSDIQGTDKNQAYTFFYIMLNVGAVLGPVIFGIASKMGHLQWGFGVVIAGVTFSAVCLLGVSKWRMPSFKALGSLLLCAGLLIGFVLWLLIHDQYFNWVMLFSGILVLCWIVTLFTRQNNREKKQLSKIILVFFCSVLFFMVSLQVGSSMTYFIEYLVNRHVWGFMIPTQWLTALDPLFVVLAAPIVIKCIGKKPPILKAIITCFSLCVIGLVFFALCSLVHDKPYWPILLLALAMLGLGAGEIALSPAILTYANEQSPNSLRSTMIGLWYLFIALAGYLSGYLSQLVSIMSFAHYYLLLAMMQMILLGVVGYLWWRQRSPR